jgi:hypothetical protein
MELTDQERTQLIEVMRDAAEALSVQAIRATGATERRDLADVARRCADTALALARANARTMT